MLAFRQLTPAPNEGVPPRPTSEENPIAESYRPHLTPAGRAHPLFRFHPDPVESDRIWNRLQPLFWYASGYKRKPATSRTPRPR